MVASLSAKPNGAHAAQQQALYVKTYTDVTAHVSVDDNFGKVKAAIESHLGLLQKQAQVKVKNWLKKLSEETANVVWKKNRNAYARLLLEQLRCGKLAEPFSALPPNGPLPTLPKHLAYAFKPARAGSPSTAQHPTAQAQQLTASEQLDEYMGRADFRRVQEQASVAAADGGSGGGDAGAGGHMQYLPGTRMQLRGTEAQRVDRHQLNDVGWQPSKLELEAQLGASRERQAELEWRLQQMEGLLRQHTLALQHGGSRGGGGGGIGGWAAGAAAAPLGSLLDAIDDGHVSPPRQRPGKKELEDLIERYEAKKRQWKSPTWAARPAAGGGRGSTAHMADSDETAILDQLDYFQRQTETIRRQLAGGAGGDAHGTGSAHLPPGSSLAVNTSSGSDWGLPDGTPLRQQPTGLRGSGHTPRAGDRQGGMQLPARQAVSLFDGLPPSPAALASSSRQAAAWGDGGNSSGGSAAGHNRHVHDAGHFEQHIEQHLEQHGSQQPQRPQYRSQHQQQQPQQPQQQAMRPPAGHASSRLAPSPAAAVVMAAAERPRSPIGPDIRHTKKSAAAAEKASGSPAAAVALQRLRGSRQPASPALAPVTFDAGQQPPAAHQQHTQHGDGRQHVAEERQRQQQVRWDEAQHDSQQRWEQQQEQQQQEPVCPLPAASMQAELPPPLQLPPDSNAALVREVQQLRSRLMASLHKHAPELAAAGVGLSSSNGSGSSGGGGLFASSKWQEQEQEAQPQGNAGGGFEAGGWRLAAVPAALPAVHAATSSSKFRLTDDSSSRSGRQRLSTDSRLDFASSYGDVAAGAQPGGSLTPGGLNSFGGGGSLGRLSSGGSLPGMHSSEFSLDAFEAQTDALRRQLEGL